MEAIGHVAAPLAGGFFLTAEHDCRVSLWSRSDRALVAEMDTVLDFGGARLALCGIKAPIVVAGAWSRHGIGGYAQDGTLLWQRKDLKRVQRLSPVAGGELVAACFDEGPMRLLVAETGETVASVRGIRGFVDGPSVGYGLGNDIDDVSAIDTGDWQVRWKAKVGGLAVLAAAVGPEGIVVATGGGFHPHDRSTSWVVALDPNGNERWRWACPAKANCPALAWDADASEWVGILHTVIGKQTRALARWSPDGKLLLTYPLGIFTDHAFLAEGRHLVTSDGAVVDTTTGDVIWDLDTPQT